MPDLELLLIRSAFGAYAVMLITSLLFTFSKKHSLSLLEFVSHASFVALMARIIRKSSSIESGENHYILTMMMLICVACFLVGIQVGRVVPTSKSSSNALSQSQSQENVAENGNNKSIKSEIMERKIKLKPRLDRELNEDNANYTSTSQQQQQGHAETVHQDHASDELVTGSAADAANEGINYKPPFADGTYAEIIEQSKSVIMSIFGLMDYPGAIPYYSQCQWSVIRSGSSANLWVSKTKDSGILLRATCLVSTPASSVMKWIVHNDLAVGIESLAYRKETLKTFRGSANKLRRLSCKSGSITSSKRDFVIISSTSVLADGTVVLASRSLQVPDEVTVAMRKPNKHGFIRGILYGSGFVLRPVRCMDSGGYDMCEIFMAVHVDMLGSASGRVNETKREVLADFVLQLLDHLKNGAANYFTGESNANLAEIGSTFEVGDKDDEGPGSGLRPAREISNDFHHHASSAAVSTSSNNALNIDLSRTGHGSKKTKEEEEVESNSRALGLDREQVRDILSRANDAISHLKQCYSSKASQAKSSIKGPCADKQLKAGEANPTGASGSSSVDRTASSSEVGTGRELTTQDLTSVVGATGMWETFYDNDGITVSELSGSNRPVGTLSASCTLEASPETIRSLLLEHQDQIDGMLAGKSVLNKIDAKTYVQWLAYRSIWPLGARDFLLVTAEKSFPTDKDSGFLIVSTSIDDICEEIDDGDTDIEDGFAASTPATPTSASSVAAAAAREQRVRKLAEFARSKIRLAGYIGIPSTTVRGGTDLSLFVDIDVYSYTPAWLVQVLAQYGLSEMMGRIRNATMGQSNNSQASQLNVILGRIQSWESRLKLYGTEDQPPLSSPPRTGVNKKFGITAAGGAAVSGQTKRTVNSSSASTLASLTTDRVARMVSDESTTSVSSSEQSENSTSIDHAKIGVIPAADASGAAAITTGDVDISSPPEPVPPPAPVRTPGQQLADHAKQLMEQYLGIRPSADLGLDWARKVSKGSVTVDTSMVAGSTWQAIRGKTTIQAHPHKLRDLLINDDRIGEFDDMFDFYKFLAQIDDHTSVRRVCFKGIWPTAPRDFVVCTTWEQREDGSILIVSRSAPDDYCPPQKGYVRGFIQVSGYWLQPMPSDAGSEPCTQVTLAAHTELGGTLPSSVINMLSTSAPVKMLGTISEIARR